MNTPAEHETVRPSFWFLLTRLLVVFAAFGLKAATADNDLDRWIMIGAIVLPVCLLAFLCRVFSVTVTGEKVTVRQGLQSTSIGTGQLASVSAGEPAGRWPRWMRNWSLTLGTTDGRQIRTALSGVSPADRRRLLAAIGERTAPGVVRRDAAMLAMLAEGDNASARRRS
ncbi:hypothetical protein ABT095_22505 [Kitasatospora sp. NPDC002227]|uniref:hypothetical protein n=1 Tax=Kitasatospora sp. NPDC002227 TaxID=3154773 RepID=UPI00332C0458